MHLIIFKYTFVKWIEFLIILNFISVFAVTTSLIIAEIRLKNNVFFKT